MFVSGRITVSEMNRKTDPPIFYIEGHGSTDVMGGVDCYGHFRPLSLVMCRAQGFHPPTEPGRGGGSERHTEEHSATGAACNRWSSNIPVSHVQGTTSKRSA